MIGWYFQLVFIKCEIMHCLSAEQILQVWEQGQTQHPIDRALTLLTLAFPDQSRSTLSQLSIGQRDTLLLHLREQMLGETMESFATCPHCSESLEFMLNTSQLRQAEPSSVEPAIQRPSRYDLAIDKYQLTFTLPNSQDLAAVVGCPNLATAQAKLTQRCLHQVTYEGDSIAPGMIPASVLQQLAQQMANYDPQAEILLDLTCPACQTEWQVLFDIVTFFWTELTVQAKRLLREVHLLARHYGWREVDILTMSPLRRQMYLDIVNP
jgi:hypothetical protein